MDATALLKGAGLGGSLIVAIGSQNAYLLRQALKREFVLTCVAICIVCDVALIAAGVAGMGQLIVAMPMLLLWLKIGGAAFLFVYGLRAARSALKPAALVAGDGATAASYGAVTAAMLAFSLLNPHVYLDTVILLGSIGGQQPGNGRFYSRSARCWRRPSGSAASVWARATWRRCSRGRWPGSCWTA